MRIFSSFAVFDWSGAAGTLQPGIRLALCDTAGAPRLIAPDARHWSRNAALAWLRQRQRDHSDMLIGLDLSAGFPFADAGAYFPGWNESPADAPALWALVDRHSAAHDNLAAHDFLTLPPVLRHFRMRGSTGEAFPPGSGRLRVTELESRRQGLANPYSCYNLVGAAQVGKASLTGMRMLHALRGHIPIWPFDPVPPSGPMIVEIYTSIAAVHAGMPRGRTKVRDLALLNGLLARLDSPPAHALALDDHSSDAMLTAAWLRRASHDRHLWHPAAMAAGIAQTEGWTFGVA